MEYLAKPWLEARKERIVEEHRRRRELQSSLVSLAVSSGVFSGIAAIWETAPLRVVEEIARFRETVVRIEAQLPVVHNWRIPRKVVSWLSQGIGRLDGSLLMLEAVASSGATREELDRALEAVREAHQALTPAADDVILKGRSHRQAFVSRKRTMWAARRAIDEGNPSRYPPLQSDD